jgi:hypothetical protein
VPVQLRGFVPVEEVGAPPVAIGQAYGAAPLGPELSFIEALEPPASLFGDLER